MLSNYTQDIRECYQQAAHCLQQAEAQNDPKVQKQFLELTRRWLLIGVWSNRFHRDTINHDTNIATITVAKAAGGWPPRIWWRGIQLVMSAFWHKADMPLVVNDVRFRG